MPRLMGGICPTLQELYGGCQTPRDLGKPIKNERRTGSSAARRRTYRVLQLYPGGFCSYCGERCDYLTIDHVESRMERGKKSGRNHLDNLVPACEACNKAKDDMTLLKFLALGLNEHGKAKLSNRNTSLAVAKYQSVGPYPIPRAPSWYRGLPFEPVADGGDNPAHCGGAGGQADGHQGISNIA